MRALSSSYKKQCVIVIAHKKIQFVSDTKRVITKIRLTKETQYDFTPVPAQAASHSSFRQVLSKTVNTVPIVPLINEVQGLRQRIRNLFPKKFMDPILVHPQVSLSLPSFHLLLLFRTPILQNYRFCIASLSRNISVMFFYRFLNPVF